MNEDEQKLREEILRKMGKTKFSVDPDTGEVDPWATFEFFNTPTDKKPEPKEETWAEHSRRILKDWGPHYNEKSSEKFFIELINRMCANLRQRGLYCRVKTNDDQRAVILVSYDRPGAKEQTFVLVNEDGINYSWHKAQNSWRYM